MANISTFESISSDIYEKNGDEDMCLLDSATTHTILKDQKYFSHLKMREINVSTINGSANLVKGFDRATIFLPQGTKCITDNALFSPQSRRNLLSFRDIRIN